MLACYFSFVPNKSPDLSHHPNKAYPLAIKQLKEEKKLPDRQQKYLNNRIKQDHHFIKEKMRSIMGFKSFHYLVKSLEPGT
ncbi:DDE-type integrase/transposase/recombinase [Baia soyae]|uniref:DDE-type integrase/transposase/recombinase n=1 Tax=Baia soyae TaxID=1544746 RepID=UPI001042B90A